MSNRILIETAFQTCIKSVLPRQRIAEAIKKTSNQISIDSSNIPISENAPIVIFGFGKAVIEMAKGAQDVLGQNRPTFLIAPKQFEGIADLKTAEIEYGGAGNLPDAESIAATNFIVSKIQQFDKPQTIFIFLISGGGSALFCSPVDGISLEQKLEVIKKMTSNGATIQELNIIRQKLSKVKGGKLLGSIKHAKVISLIISDIVGSEINLIASGPTVPQPSSKPDYTTILSKLQIPLESLPNNVSSILSKPETTVDTLPEVHNFIVSSNETALSSIENFLSSQNFHTIIVSSSLCGNATEIGKQFSKLLQSSEIARILSEISGANFDESQLKFPLALIFGGETTVILKGRGKGGRNQEMVLACFEDLRENKQQIKHNFTFLSAGTDGQDGPTDAAGAIISNQDLQIPSILSPSEYLSTSDSYNFWRQFNDGNNHLKTGSTGTNVMDIQILLLEKP